jgi:glycosyltransferase involved in cell wall biosynthesis
MLARVGEVWVLTRPFALRRDMISRRLEELPPAERPHIVFVDLPRWAGGGADVGSTRLRRVRYLYWQALALREARWLHRRHAFDLAWHLTFSNVWLGSLASLIGPPFIFGPVGGGVGPPWRLVAKLGWQGAAYEVARALGKVAARYLNPVIRWDWRRATLILVQNRETRDWFPTSVRSKIAIFPNSILEDRDGPAVSVSGDAPDERPLALFAGRLMPLKGVALALEAIRLLPGWRFVICGAGRDETRLRRLATRLGLNDRVEFRGWVPRPDLLALMHRADVLLFPSFHEEGGWAVAEALATGLPVVCFDRGGPAALNAQFVRSGWPGETIRALATAVEAARAGPRPTAPAFEEATRRSELVKLLRRHGVLETSGVDPVDAQPRA